MAKKPAGQAAQASSPIHTTAPQQQSSEAEHAMMAMNMLKMRTDIARSAAEIGMMAQQAQHIREQDRLLVANREHIANQMRRENLEMRIRQSDWDKSEDFNLRTTDSGLAAQISSILRMMEAAREGRAGIAGRMVTALEDAVKNLSANPQVNHQQQQQHDQLYNSPISPAYRSQGARNQEVRRSSQAGARTPRS